jgi:hypothetical protein
MNSQDFAELGWNIYTANRRWIARNRHNNRQFTAGTLQALLAKLTDYTRHPQYYDVA